MQSINHTRSEALAIELFCYRHNLEECPLFCHKIKIDTDSYRLAHLSGSVGDSNNLQRPKGLPMSGPIHTINNYHLITDLCVYLVR